LIVNDTETSVGTGSGLLRQQNIHVLVFGDLVGSLVDPLAAELVFLPETVVKILNCVNSFLFFPREFKKNVYL
jgi:hypothetical protein